MSGRPDSQTPGPDRAWPGPDSPGVPDTSSGVSCSPEWPGGLWPAGGLSQRGLQSLPRPGSGSVSVSQSSWSGRETWHRTWRRMVWNLETELERTCQERSGPSSVVLYQPGSSCPREPYSSLKNYCPVWPSPYKILQSEQMLLLLLLCVMKLPNEL